MKAVRPGRVPFVLLAILPIALVSCQPTVPASISGSDGIGDPYYPQLGNGGYDVQKYTLTLKIDPPTNTLTGEARIEAQALQRLGAFNLDFQGLTIDSVTVNEKRANYSRKDQELTVKPKQPVEPNSTFVTVLRYHGQPEYGESMTTPGVIQGVGWFHSQDGSINVINEPNGASTWYPVNDHPRDKAAYLFQITVSRPWVAAVTGVLKETVDQGENRRYVFEMEQPIASYLVSINIDRYEVETEDGPDGIVIRNYFPAGFPAEEKKAIQATPEMLSYFASIFGTYPFHEYGVVVVNPSILPCNSVTGGAVETQTLTTICTKLDSDENIIAHELAHQWFGDSVSLENWQDLWLKEGMATYAEWLWQTRDHGIEELNQIAVKEKDHLFLFSKVAQPPAEDLYGYEQYAGGALAFHALRLKVGDEVFFKILRTYLDRFRFGNASTEDFIALSEEVSGQELSSFFDSWLLSTSLPEFPAGSK